MKFHHSKTDEGLKIAYLSEPKGNIDELVRCALGINGARVILDPNQISLDRPYVLNIGNYKVYFTPNTDLKNTHIFVRVARDQRIIPVSIYSQLDMPTSELIYNIESRIIESLSAKGLVPIESTREQIPKSMLGSI